MYVREWSLAYLDASPLLPVPRPYHVLPLPSSCHAYPPNLTARSIWLPPASRLPYIKQARLGLLVLPARTTGGAKREWTAPAHVPLLCGAQPGTLHTCNQHN